MNFYEYLYIVIPYSFIMFFLIIFYARQLKVFEYGYTLGFMGSIWYLYEFIFFPLLGWFYFNWWYKDKNPYIVYLMFVIVIVYFIFMFIGFYISNEKKFFLNILVKFLLVKKTQQVRISTKLIIFIYLFIICLKEYNNYITYGTINSFEILSNISLLSEEQIINIQKGYQIYFDAFLTDITRLIFILTMGYFLLNKKIFISFIILLINFYIMLAERSKYVLIYPLIYLAMYSFFVKKIKLKYMVIVVLLTSIIGIYLINVVRSGGSINLSKDNINYMITIVIWRGDFFHALYPLLEKMEEGNILPSGGITIVSVLTRFIPRSIWPDRYGSSDVELTKQLFHFEGKGWSMNFGGIGEFIYSFDLVGIIFIGLYAGIVIFTFNKLLINSIQQKNLIIVSFILSNPIWFIPWNIGINDYFGRKFIFSFFSYYILLFIILTLSKLKFKI